MSNSSTCRWVRTTSSRPIRASTSSNARTLEERARTYLPVSLHVTGTRFRAIPFWFNPTAVSRSTATKCLRCPTSCSWANRRTPCPCATRTRAVCSTSGRTRKSSPHPRSSRCPSRSRSRASIHENDLRVPSGRSVWIVFAALFVSIAAEAAVVQVVGASAAPPALSVTPHGNLSNGQTVAVAVGPNAYFTPHAGVNILECADPGGSVADLPKDITACDGNTIQGSTILVAADGSFSVPTYPVYALPSSALGEQSNYKPLCNQTNSCVLYVGQNQNDFTAPKVFSAPFTIAAGSGTATSTTATSPTAPATTNSTGSSGSTSTTVAA